MRILRDEDAEMDVRSDEKRYDQDEYIRGKTRVVRASKNITKKRLKWYIDVMTTKEEHIVRRMLDAATPGKEEEGGQTQYGRMRVREI